jgi:hypothetical protein
MHAWLICNQLQCIKYFLVYEAPLINTFNYHKRRNIKAYLHCTTFAKTAAYNLLKDRSLIHRGAGGDEKLDVKILLPPLAYIHVS